MNQIGFAKRKNSNKVLFHFDSLVDLHLAVVYALQKDYPSGGSMQSINYSFLHQSRMELKKHRIFDIGKEVIQECFLGNMQYLRRRFGNQRIHLYMEIAARAHRHACHSKRFNQVRHNLSIKS